MMIDELVFKRTQTTVLRAKQMEQIRSAVLTQIQKLQGGSVLVSEAKGTIDELMALYIEIGGKEADFNNSF